MYYIYAKKCCNMTWPEVELNWLDMKWIDETVRVSRDINPPPLDLHPLLAPVQLIYIFKYYFSFDTVNMYKKITSTKQLFFLRGLTAKQKIPLALNFGGVWWCKIIHPGKKPKKCPVYWMFKCSEGKRTFKLDDLKI